MCYQSFKLDKVIDEKLSSLTEDEIKSYITQLKNFISHIEGDENESNTKG